MKIDFIESHSDSVSPKAEKNGSINEINGGKGQSIADGEYSFAYVYSPLGTGTSYCTAPNRSEQLESWQPLNAYVLPFMK